MRRQLNWNELAIELHARAAKYTWLMEKYDRRQTEFTTPTVEAPPLLFPPGSLAQLDQQDQPHPEQWWWVFSPWLTALLSGSYDLTAYLVCIGYHIGPLTKPTRKWLHFMPDNTSTDERRTLEYFVGYNIKNTDDDRKNLLLTTEVLERIDRLDRQEALRRPRLRPLLVCFDTQRGTGDDESQSTRLVKAIYNEYQDFTAPPLRCVDWALLREYAQRGANAVHANHNIDDYFNQLSATASSFRDKLAQSGRLIEEVLLGPRENKAALADVRACLEGEEGPDHDPDYLSKLCKFAFWIHDVVSRTEWAYLFTIPFWLPPTTTGARDGSAILYLRPNGLLDEPPKVIRRLLDCTATALAGSAFMAHDRIRGLTGAGVEVPIVVGERIRKTLSEHPDAVGVLCSHEDTWYICMQGTGAQAPTRKLSGTHRKGWKGIRAILNSSEAQPRDIIAREMGIMNKTARPITTDERLTAGAGLANGSLSTSNKPSDTAFNAKLRQVGLPHANSLFESTYPFTVFSA